MTLSPPGTRVTFASVVWASSLVLDLQFTSSHIYTAGDSATWDVGVNSLVLVTSCSLPTAYGCSPSTTFTVRTLTLTLADGTGQCRVPAGATLELACFVVAGSFSTFTLTTNRDPVPYFGTLMG
eukprot:EG_transcript_26777